MKRRDFLKLGVAGIVAVVTPTALKAAGLLRENVAEAEVVEFLNEPVLGRTFYISSLATGKGDGSSWGNAFKTLLEATKKAQVDGICAGHTFLVDNAHNEEAISDGHYLHCNFDMDAKKDKTNSFTSLNKLKPNWKWGDDFE